MRRFILLSFLIWIAGCGKREGNLPSLLEADEMAEVVQFSSEVQREGNLPSPLEADEMAEVVQFSSEVHLQCTNVEWGAELGEVIWAYGYDDPERTHYHHVIGLYKKGTLFNVGKFKGTRRQTEDDIRDCVAKLENLETEGLTLGFRNPGFGFRKTEDGREIFCQPLGFGPGGELTGVFSTVQGYDLLMMEGIEYEDGTPVEEQLKNPSKPERDVWDIFAEVEKRIFNME